LWKFYLICLRVVGGLKARPSLRSKATVEEPIGHIGGEMTQVAEMNVKLSFYIVGI